MIINMTSKKGEWLKVNKMLETESLTKKEQGELRKGENRISLKGTTKVYGNKHIFYMACNEVLLTSLKKTMQTRLKLLQS